MSKRRFPLGSLTFLNGIARRGPGAGLDTAAEVLGMTPEELFAEMTAGKNLAEVAEEQDVDPQAIVDAVHAQAEKRLQQAVADGCLTQEQADRMLERMAEHEGDILSAPGRRFGFGHGGRGRWHKRACSRGFSQAR